MMVRNGDFMQTYSGMTFWPLDPRPNEILIEDIARSLSFQCRFGGHVRKFYSVAEHSVLMASKASPENRLWCLLHDATEAYLSDIIRPVKRHLKGYLEIEARLMISVCDRFGISTIMPDEVKALDNRILIDERAQIMTKTDEVWDFCGESEGLGLTIEGWSPEVAEQKYLEAFREVQAS